MNEQRMAQINYAKENYQKDESYQAFEDKFKPKLTTDDCFTPPIVYEAVKDWAIAEYGWQGREVIRPFYPGGDYANYDYPDQCVVIDNPPFSIITKIVRFFERRGIDFFLFAPEKTVLSIRATSCLFTGESVTYENGAIVSTAFVASKGKRIRSVPELGRVVKEAEKKAIFGAGYLIDDVQAARAARAEKKVTWTLSDRERGIIEELNRSNGAVEAASHSKS